MGLMLFFNLPLKIIVIMLVGFLTLKRIHKQFIFPDLTLIKFVVLFLNGGIPSGLVLIK